MPKPRLMDHVILCFGVLVMVLPVAFLVWRFGTSGTPEDLMALMKTLWTDGFGRMSIGAGDMFWNSLILALGLALFKTAVSLLAAYALVFFQLRGAMFIYSAILLTLFFPIESRLIPTFLVTSQLSLLNSHAGMILPVAASGLGVLIFRQYMLQLPPDVIEAARIDGAGPLRVLLDFVIPLSAPMMAALFAILFVLGWHQYVWPIMITTTSTAHTTLMGGMANAGFAGPGGLGLALLALIPPCIVVLVLQRWLMRGLTNGIH